MKALFAAMLVVVAWVMPARASTVDYQAFAKFTLSSDAILGDATYVTIDPADLSTGSAFVLNDLRVSIYSDITRTPLYTTDFSAAQIKMTPIGTTTINAHLVDEVTVSLPPWFLSAGEYWISFFGVNGSRNLFYAMDSSVTTEYAQRSFLPDSEGYYPRDRTGAFRLEASDGATLFENAWTLETLSSPSCSPCAVISPPAAVPVPAALPLLASGLATFGFMGWCRKRKTAVDA
jgi:hypothetical protein